MHDFLDFCLKVSSVSACCYGTGLIVETSAKSLEKSSRRVTETVGKVFQQLATLPFCLLVGIVGISSPYLGIGLGVLANLALIAIPIFNSICPDGFFKIPDLLTSTAAKIMGATNAIFLADYCLGPIGGAGVTVGANVLGLFNIAYAIKD